MFARYSAERTRAGISTEGVSALKHLLRQTFQRGERPAPPPRGDTGYLRALDEVSFDVAAGEVLGIIGRNGAGKSTLLNILARVMHPTSGRAELYGRVVSMLELGIGLAPALTVRQNIHLQGRLAGIPGRRIAEVEEEILDFSGLREYANEPLRLVPSGGAVQLSFAAMIGLGAETVLADEVLAVGDAAFRKACEARVLNAGASGESVLFVSHDMEAIKRICTRVIWIDRGRIVRDGPTDDVVEAYMSELLAGHLRPPSPAGEAAPAGGCALLDLRLLDASHAQVGALQLTERGYIDCLFRAHAGTSVVVEFILSSRKVPVLAARSTPITTGAATTFRAGIAIPVDFLNEQRYEARVRLHARRLIDTGEYASVADERLGFSAMNPHPERSVWNDWPWGRGGLLTPRLSWSIQPARQEAGE